MHIAAVTIVVREYDEALQFYVGKLGFACIEDTDLGSGKRWVRVQPPGGGPCLLLAKAASDAQGASVGNQTGGRVAMFFETDNLKADYVRLVAQGVTFIRAPTQEVYGTVAVFEDLYGNRFDLIERA
jgi:catechol 2,3-dioxygenase-like lactoylglutathione lyase family enzyme